MQLKRIIRAGFARLGALAVAATVTASVALISALVSARPAVAASPAINNATDYYNSKYFFVWSDGNQSPNYGKDANHAPYYVLKKINNNGKIGFAKQVIYCLDESDKPPATTSSPFTEPGGDVPKKNWTKWTNEDNFFVAASSGPATDADINNVTTNNSNDAGANIRKVVYNGYPLNKAGIQQAYNLSDMEFRSVTQAAVWYYGTHHGLTWTDKEGIMNDLKDVLTNDHFSWNQNCIYAYYILTGYKTNPNITLQEPQGLDLRMYENAQVPSGYQRLIAIEGEGSLETSVTKKWEGSGTKPASIKVQLLADGAVEHEATLNASNSWYASFKNLREYGIDGQGNLKKLTYSVVENPVPSGFTSTITGAVTGGFTITNTFPSKPKDIVISKQNVAGEELAGAQITLSKKGGSQVDAWTSTSEPHTVALEPGEYIFHEVAAPKGYTTVTDITFTVKDDGTVVVNDTQARATGATLTVIDQAEPETPVEPKEIVISKQNIAGEELAGAQITLSKKGGSQVDAWTSTTEPHTVALEPGGYVFHEVAAPKGYTTVTDITFTVKDDGTVEVTDTQARATGATLTVIDQAEPETPVEPKDIVISKKNVAGEELAGAQITLTKQGGSQVDAWTSTTEPHKVKLEPGEYIFHEVAAPKGYTVVTDITFTVKDDGTVVVNDTQARATGATLTVIDQAEPETPEVPPTTPPTEEPPVEEQPVVTPPASSLLPKTSDITGIVGIVALIAVVVLAVALMLKRRSK